MARVSAVLAVVATLALLVSSCGGEQGGDQSSVEQGSIEASSAEQSSTERSSVEPGKEEAAGQPKSPEEELAEEFRGALVPVAHLTSSVEDVSVEELSGAAELAVPQASREAAGELLGASSGFEEFDSAGAVVDHVSRTPEALGLVPWEAVTPRVKALSVGGVSLLAPGATLDGYPLALEGMARPDPGELRRVVVGGDIVLDRGQPYAVIEQGLGLDFPLDGGYAAITGRELVPNPYSESELVNQVTAERQGGAGAIREYLNGADLTLANFENPVLENAVYHPDAPTFNGDLRLLPLLEGAGIDGVTLANNHILDAGVPGLEETLGHLQEAGVSHAGAGADLAAAREPMVFDLGGVTVGVLSYLGVPSYEWSWAGESSPGTAPLEEEVVREDVEALKSRVDLVMVMPHWGMEYLAEPEPGQVDLAHAAVDAGADLVVGDHAHWPKGVEVYEDRPVFYGTGNFLFDQSWSEETSTGIFADVVLYEDRVVQARPVPFLILDRAQPNFLVPEAGGERALGIIYAASVGPEFEAYEGGD